MRKHIYKVMAVLTATLFITACTEDDRVLRNDDTGKTPVTIGSMTVDTSVNSRATNAQTGTFGWENGDLIKVTASPVTAVNGQNVYTTIYAYTLPTDPGSTGTWAPAIGAGYENNGPLYRENVDGAGEYTFCVETWGGVQAPIGTSDANGNATLVKDQNTTEKYRLSDYIQGPATLEKGGILTATNDAALTHRTVDLVVTIRRGKWDEANAAKSNADFTDSIRNATLRFYSTEGADITPYVRFSTAPKESTRATAILRAHIPLGSLLGTDGATQVPLLTMTLKGGRTLTATYTRPASDLDNGKRLVVEVDYDNLSGLTSLSATIKPWDNGLNRAPLLYIASVGTTHVNNQDGNSDYTAAIGDQLLVQSTGLEGGKALLSYQTVAGTPQWKIEAPVYWDSNQGGSSDFYALLTPALQPVGDNERDLLQATKPGVAIGSDLVFDQMKHAMSKVTLTLTPAGLYNVADLADATVYWNGLKRLKEQKADGTLTLSDEASNLQLNKVNGAYTLLIAPQALTAANNTLVVNIGERSYKLDLIKLTSADGTPTAMDALKPGQHYLLNAILDKVASSVTLTTGNWTTASSTVSVHIAQIGGMTSLNPGNSYAPAANDALLLFSDQIVTGKDEELNYATYVYGNTSWTTNSPYPIYWKPEQKDYSFVACITPGKALGHGNERDYLYGKTFTKDGIVTSDDLEYGDDLYFPVVHIMSRITVKLAAGTDVTNEELVKASINWPGIIATASVTPNREGYLVKMSDNQSVVSLIQRTGDYALTFDAIVAPQEITSNNRYLQLKLGQRVYQMDMAALKADEKDTTPTAAITTLEPAKQYVITATVSRQETTMTLDISPWTEAGQGNGLFDYNGYHKVN